jgi:hypothetical protein
MELEDNFYDRIYVNFSEDMVFVYETPSKKGSFQIWDIATARRHLKILQTKELTIL